MVEEEVKEIVKDLLKDLQTAEKEMGTAEELIKIAEEAGIDVAQPRSDLRFLRADADRYKKVLEKRVKK